MDGALQWHLRARQFYSQSTPGAMALGSEFFRTVDLGQQHDTVSHFGCMVFIQFNNSLLAYHTRRDTLPYLTKSSNLLDIHFGALHSA